jgi:ribosomal protein L12E/L44/L45/RPP1/RPP2
VDDIKKMGVKVEDKDLADVLKKAKPNPPAPTKKEEPKKEEPKAAANTATPLEGGRKEEGGCIS